LHIVKFLGLSRADLRDLCASEAAISWNLLSVVVSFGVAGLFLGGIFDIFRDLAFSTPEGA
jgi:hypothetical protein